MFKFMNTEKLVCVCNGSKPLTTYAAEINADNKPCSIKKLKIKYKCGTKCGLCIPHLKKLLNVPTEF